MASHRRIKFPTGVVAWLDENDTLQGSPPEIIASLASRREKAGELNSFELFLKGLLALPKKSL